MNTLTCIIVDDERNALQVLQALAQQSGLLQVVLATTKPQQALEFVAHNPVQLALLDINMPGITGLELAKALQGRCKVIFTTGHSQFVTDAYELQVMDYLLKPIALARFIGAVNRVINVIEPNQQKLVETSTLEHDYFFVKTDQKGKRVKINIADIDYIHSRDNYLYIHHNGQQQTMVLQTMKSIEERLPAQHFLRIHKSYIVAIRKITVIDGATIGLGHIETHLPIGDTYKAALLQAMQDKLL
jgi:two-component system, LytTR family, response regulator